MKRLLTAAAIGLALHLGAAPGIAWAGDVPYDVAVGSDDRPVAAGKVAAYNRNGTVYIDVVRATRIFSGLLTFSSGGSAVTLTIGKQTGAFTVGETTAAINGRTTELKGAPFVVDGDIYVPLITVCYLAGATMTVHPSHHVVHINVGSAALPPAPAASHDAGADEALGPSPAQALTFMPSGAVDATGLHARVELINTTPKPFTLSFPSGTQVAFIVFKNGSEVWNSLSEKQTAEAETTLTLDSREKRTFTADWPGFTHAGAGRYTLRARLLTTTPLDSASVSLGLMSPSPSSS